jgi:hypothetical protein
MIDKLDVRMPKSAVTGRVVEQALSWNPSNRDKSPMQHSLHYGARIDFRPLGIDAMLHHGCRHGDGHSKLEIHDVGQKGLAEITWIIACVTDCDPNEFPIMRIDFAADIPGVSVGWFRDHARFKFKRSEREFGQAPWGTIGTGEVETLNWGKRPNLYRVYNKIREWQVQFRLKQRRKSPDADELEFEKEFGWNLTDTLTRIERQCGVRNIPPDCALFGGLKESIKFNPFDRMELISSGQKECPSPSECGGLDYFTGIGLLRESERIGMQGLRKLINQMTRGNAARTLNNYQRFFRNDSVTISMEQIFDNFRQSTIKQLSS